MNETHIQRARKIVLAERLAACYEEDTVKPVYTPDDLADEMISKLLSIDGDVLVISDLGLLVAVVKRLKVEGKDRAKVRFLAHTSKQEAFSRELTVKTWQIGYNDPIKEFEKHLMGLKFDIIVGNPPYLKGMHIKMIKASLDYLEDDGVCMMIHPSTPYIRPGKDKLKKHLTHLELRPAKSIWDTVKLWVPIAIATLSKQEQSHFSFEGKQIAQDTQLTPHGLPSAVVNLRDKLSSGETLNLKVTEGTATAPFIVSLPYISGNAQARDMYFLLPQRAKLVDSVKQVPGTWFNVSFNTEAEALNFARYLTSKLAMAGFAMCKLNQHVYLHDLVSIPWLDFTRHWTDEDLYTHFKLTPEEIAWVEALPAHPRRSDPV